MLKKLRDDFKGMDLAKTTRDTRYKKQKRTSLGTSIILGWTPTPSQPKKIKKEDHNEVVKDQLPEE